MAKISKSKVTVDIKLDKYPLYNKLTPREKGDVKYEIGEAVISEIQDYLGGGITPVSGGDYKRELSKKYKEIKDGAPYADLLLDGDLWNAMEYKPTSKGVEIGIFDSDQAPKAYNHQVGDTLPRRQYLPDSGQSFKRPIESRIRAIIKETYENRD